MEIKEIVKEMGEIRKLPQFLFCSGIDPKSMIETRSAIIEYKIANPDSDAIDFIINSPGGSPGDAYRIIRTLRNNFKTVNIIVPFWAKSAATLLALGGNHIIMDEFGEFGPLDIQIGVERDDSPEFNIESALNDEYSVRQIESRAQQSFYQMFMTLYKSKEVKINKNDLSKQILDYLAAFYEPLLKQINPYSLGKKKRLLDIGENYAQRILIAYNHDLQDDNRDMLVDFLVNGCPDHGYVIDYNILKTILNNVKSTEQISLEYKNVVRNLATEFLILSQDSNYVGFILKEDKSDDESIVEEQDFHNKLNTETVDTTTIDNKSKSNGNEKHKSKTKSIK